MYKKVHNGTYKTPLIHKIIPIKTYIWTLIINITISLVVKKIIKIFKGHIGNPTNYYDNTGGGQGGFGVFISTGGGKEGVIVLNINSNP